MKKNPPPTSRTSVGRREAQRSISPRVSWPVSAARRRSSGVMAHICSRRSGRRVRMAAMGIAVRVCCVETFVANRDSTTAAELAKRFRVA